MPARDRGESPRHQSLVRPYPPVQTAASGPLKPSGFVTFVTLVVVVVILRVAEDVIVPVSLGVLLAFILTPCVNQLTRWGVPDALAVGLTATLGFAVLAGIGWTVGTQAVGVLEELPRYEENIRAKIVSLKQLRPPGSLSRTKGLVETLRKDVVAPQAPEAEPSSDAEKKRRPVPVAIAESETTSLQIFRQLAMPVLGPLGTGGIVIIFVLAILFQRHDLRDRLINLVSAGRINMATQAVDDAAKRVSRYLGTQLLVNAAYGIPVGFGLYFIGVPGAVLWGLLATVLRFIPFLGPWIAAAFPLVLAAAIDPGWTKFLYAAALFVILELISNNVIEVLAYGARTGISSFALLVAAVFWTWLWGAAGLFLSTPLTVCLLVTGKYVPGLKFLNILLGSEPALTPPVLFYQRMLLMHYDEMHELATAYIAERSLTAFYDDVFIPALILAEEDRHSGTLAEVRQRFIFQAGRELIEDLLQDTDESATGDTKLDDRRRASAIVLGIAAHDEADELAALMLQHVLQLRGQVIDIAPLARSAAEHAASIADRRITTVVLSALPPSALVAARQMCRTIKNENQTVHVLVGIWSQEARAAELKPRFRHAQPDEIATTLAAAVSHLESRGQRADAPTPAVGVRDALLPKKPDHLAGAHEPSPQDNYERTIRSLAQAFAVPASLVKVIDTDRDFWSELPWFPSEQDPVRDALRDLPMAASSHGDPAVVVIEDLRKDHRLALHPVLVDRGVSFVAGVPLCLEDGRMVGILGVIDTKVRAVTDELRQTLHDQAAELMANAARDRPGAASSQPAAARPQPKHAATA